MRQQSLSCIIVIRKGLLAQNTMNMVMTRPAKPEYALDHFLAFKLLLSAPVAMTHTGNEVMFGKLSYLPSTKLTTR